MVLVEAPAFLETRTQSALAEREAPNLPTVVVIPGYYSTDERVRGFREDISDMGYQTFPSGIKFNDGDFWRDVYQVEQQLKLNPNSQYVLIGWSHGGVIARDVAIKNPDRVKQIVTLAAPLQWRFLSLTAFWGVQLPREIQHLNLYGRRDVFVRPHDALAIDPHATNEEVDETHFSIIASSKVKDRIQEILADLPAKTVQ